MQNTDTWRLDFMILMRANPLLRPLEGVFLENLDFLGPGPDQISDKERRSAKNLSMGENSS
jgi:hypothetical protein